MPLYMDIHELPEGMSAEEVAKAHEMDLATQRKYGVDYRKYWLNESSGKLFCLVHAPSAEAANDVHREAHGQVAERIIEITPPELAEGLLGGVETHSCGAVLVPGTVDARDSGIRTVLFTDIVGSTSLTQSVGDEAAMELLHLHDTIVREALDSLGGREVKHTGDGIMASFVSAADAVKCASRIQSELARRDSVEGERRVKIRIGAAAGEPVEHHSDLFGSTVQLAARLCAHALPDQIVVSNVVAELCTGKRLPFRDLGEVTLKGFEQPIRAHAVVWESDAT